MDDPSYSYEEMKKDLEKMAMKFGLEPQFVMPLDKDEAENTQEKRKE